MDGYSVCIKLGHFFMAMQRCLDKLFPVGYIYFGYEIQAQEYKHTLYKDIENELSVTFLSFPLGNLRMFLPRRSRRNH